MPPSKIMLIRHAERPDPNGNFGVTIAGREDRRELSVRGWQRAGALISLFGPSVTRGSVSRLASPTAIFASRPTPNSVRPLHTVETLAQLLSIGIGVSYDNGDEAALVASALNAGGVVLVSWKHDALPRLGNTIIGDTIIGDTETCPQTWPAERFDLVWVFDRVDASSPWKFEQVPQLLLHGDRTEPIAKS